MTITDDLTGTQLHNGWTVTARNPRETTTGGHFSRGYIVSHEDGRTAFAKVLDYKTALESDDVSAALRPLLEAFEFERDLLRECHDLSRIVTAIESGQVRVSDIPIQYLIFELADGDARQQRQILNRFDVAWSMRTLHGVALALEQLHGRGIAHQDIKPSNVLIFFQNYARVADLGRSCHQNRSGPHDSEDFPGDIRYAPPEYQYGFCPTDWGTRRRASDLYLLGSLASFLVCGASMSELTAYHEDPAHSPDNWSDPFTSIIPFLVHYQSLALETLRNQMQNNVSPDVLSDFLLAIQWLCNPDPAKRGHPQAHRQGTPFDLRRFVALFDLLAKKQSIFLRSGNS